MEMTLATFIPAGPEIFVLTMACIILLIDLFCRTKFNIAYYLVQLTLLIAAGLTWSQWSLAPVVTFHDTFVLDKFAIVLKLVVYFLNFFVFWYSRQYTDDRNMLRGEYYVLGLLSTLGMMVLISAHNFLTLYLGLELLSLPIYVMIALRRDQGPCIEAALKYFVFGALASGMLLYGISMIFGATHSLDIQQVAHAIDHITVSHNLILIFGLVFMLVGIVFKLGAAPFHMWVPDVYEGAPNSVTLFLSTAPKVAAFALAIRLLVQAMPELHGQWQQVLIVVSILSMAIGNLVAIVQTNIKRMLGYSSIAQMGYMLLGLLSVTKAGYAAAMFYSISYAIMTLGAFGLLVLMSGVGFECENIADFAGLNDRHPWLAFMMLLLMFSMAGIPPIVGFVAKLGVLESLISVHLVWLAVLALLFAIIGAFYYLRVVKVMYFDAPHPQMNSVSCGKGVGTAITINGLLVLLLGILPGFLFTICHQVFATLGY